MPRIILPEESLHMVEHPEVLKGRSRVHHEIANRITYGHGDYPGDSRMALYLNHRIPRWEIWRLELDNEYHCAARSPKNARLGEDTWNMLVAHLRATDVRLGFDAVEHVEKHEAALERRNERDFADKIEDIASTYLLPAFKKVGFHRYL